MKQRYVLALLAAITATPAAAQQVMPSGGLPPHEILTIVRSAGLDPLGPPILRGRHYVLRAIGNADREVSVLVDGRSGGILSITPVVTASRMSPRGVAPESYERAPYGRPASGYIPAEPPDGYQVGPPMVYQGRPGVYRMGPPIVYEDDPPIDYAPRPPALVPGAQPPVVRSSPPPVLRGGPPRVITATPPEDIASADPDTITTRGRAGALPPPPERFPQRVPPATAAKPKPEKRAVAAVPKQAPLPKPRPAANADAPQGSFDAVPPLVPEQKPDASALPN